MIPGISSVQSLAARHRVSLTQVGRPLHITTGRRLAADGFPEHCDDVVVMLDARCSFTGVDPGAEIYWGAYLGDQGRDPAVGPRGDVAARIEAARTRGAGAQGLDHGHLPAAPPRVPNMARVAERESSDGRFLAAAIEEAGPGRAEGGVPVGAGGSSTANWSPPAGTGGSSGAA